MAFKQFAVKVTFRQLLEDNPDTWREYIDAQLPPSALLPQLRHRQSTSLLNRRNSGDKLNHYRSSCRPPTQNQGLFWRFWLEPFDKSDGLIA